MRWALLVAALISLEGSMKKPLTSTQREYFDAITAHLQKTGLFPTIREIMKATSRRSPCGVECGLKQLEAKRWIDRIGSFKEPRGYRLPTNQGQQIVQNNTICPKGFPVRAGSTVFIVDGKLAGIWTPAHLLEALA